MGRVDAKLAELGLSLPEPIHVPPGVAIPFAWARVHGDRVYIAGHSPLAPDGTPAGPFGSVPSQVSVEQARLAARATALSVFASLQRAIGDLDRITAWLTVAGMVNADPGFGHTTTVINGFSDLILAIFGREIGAHARTAIGAASLPLNNTIVVSAEVAFGPPGQT